VAMAAAAPLLAPPLPPEPAVVELAAVPDAELAEGLAEPAANPVPTAIPVDAAGKSIDCVPPPFLIVASLGPVLADSGGLVE
jgi:hypothetical protein